MVPYPFFDKSTGLSTGIDLDFSKRVAKTGLLMLYHIIIKFIKKLTLAATRNLASLFDVENKMLPSTN